MEEINEKVKELGLYSVHLPNNHRHSQNVNGFNSLVDLYTNI